MGTSTSRSPRTWVLVVVERITVFDGACAAVGSAAIRIVARARNVDGSMMTPSVSQGHVRSASRGAQPAPALAGEQGGHAECCRHRRGQEARPVAVTLHEEGDE